AAAFAAQRAQGHGVHFIAHRGIERDAARCSQPVAVGKVGAYALIGPVTYRGCERAARRTHPAAQGAPLVWIRMSAHARRSAGQSRAGRKGRYPEVPVRTVALGPE